MYNSTYGHAGKYATALHNITATLLHYKWSEQVDSSMVKRKLSYLKPRSREICQDLLFQRFKISSAVKAIFCYFPNNRTTSVNPILSSYRSKGVTNARMAYSFMIVLHHKSRQMQSAASLGDAGYNLPEHFLVAS